MVTLPGFPSRTFEDQWVAVLPGTPGSVPGPASVPGTFWYLPIAGERDQSGFLRVDDPTNPQIGAGSRPFFDVGAFERRIIVPPKIDDVTAVFTNAANPGGIEIGDFYAEGGIAGSNTSPRTIRLEFDRQLDRNTINNRTIVLEASGGDGIFRNDNNSSDRFIDLAGKLSYDPATGIVSIDLTGVNPSLGSDLYRVTVFGDGADVVRDPQGIALDGENTTGNSPTGSAASAAERQRHPGRQLLPVLRDRQPAAVDRGRNAAARPGQRYRRQQHATASPPTTRRPSPARSRICRPRPIRCSARRSTWNCRR